MKCPTEQQLIQQMALEKPEGALDEHLRECSACRERADALGGVWAVLGGWTVTPPERDLAGAVLASAAASAPVRRPLSWLRIAAAVLVAGGAGVLAGRLAPLRPSPTPPAVSTSEVVNALGLDMLGDDGMVLQDLFDAGESDSGQGGV